MPCIKRNLISNLQPMTESAMTGRPARQRRLRVPDRPDKSINLWSIVKNCIGKDLTKIPVPVNFSEPLSFLQRLTEDYVYAEILHRAALCKDNYEQVRRQSVDVWYVALSTSVMSPDGDGSGVHRVVLRDDGDPSGEAVQPFARRDLRVRPQR